MIVARALRALLPAECELCGYKRKTREKMGRVDKELMDRVDAAIAVSFGLHSERLV